MIIDKQVEKMKQDVADLEEKLESVERKNTKLQARRWKKENEISYQNRRQRVHRLIGIGAEVESVMGRQIPKEDLPAFREYLKTAERKIGAFNVVDGRCSFMLP